MNFNIALIPGDGIGPEVTSQAVKVLKAVGKKYNHNFTFTSLLAGGAALDAVGIPLPKETVDQCKSSHAVLLGAVGGPKWDSLPSHMRPEVGALLPLRKELGLYANLRPAILFPALADACPLKPELTSGGFDIMVVRELTGGIYFGRKGTSVNPEGEVAFDVEEYSTEEIRRIAITAFDLAMKRSKKVTSVDKANVLESSKLWRKTVIEVAKDYPEVTLEHLYVDNASMQLVRNPKTFDVILTNNIFGDILSDEASMIAGSIGMLPSASLASGSFGLYEPIHGSAPDIAGKNIANPLATILSAAMMLKYSFNLKEEGSAIEAAVGSFLEKGYRTADIFTEGFTLVGTEETGSYIAENL